MRACECAGMYAMYTHEEARENIVCLLLCFSSLFPWGRLSHWIGSSPFWLGWLSCFCPNAAMASTCNHAWLFYMGDGDSNSGFHTCSVSTFAHWTVSSGPHQVFLIVFYHLKKLVMSSFQPRNPWLWILTGYQAYDFPLYVLVCAYKKKKKLVTLEVFWLEICRSSVHFIYFHSSKLLHVTVLNQCIVSVTLVASSSSSYTVPSVPRSSFSFSFSLLCVTKASVRCLGICLTLNSSSR